MMASKEPQDYSRAESGVGTLSALIGIRWDDSFIRRFP
jgi:hypothetical protein